MLSSGDFMRLAFKFRTMVYLTWCEIGIEDHFLCMINQLFQHHL
jgi:hypothetical protein